MVKVKMKVLKTIMKANNLNQTELAKVIGVDQALISKIIKNKRVTVGGKFIAGLIRYTGMQFDDLFFLSTENAMTNSFNLPPIPSDLPQVESLDQETKNHIAKKKEAVL